MGRVIVFNAPRSISIEQEEDRRLEPGELRLRTLYSGISAGTELTAYRGSNPYLHKKWDPASKLFLAAAAPTQPYPLVGWGYEEVGEVVEIGAEVTELKIGNLVYGNWGHRTHYILGEELAGKRILPAGLEPVLGIFSHIGAISLNGVHDAGLRIGETVAVFGMGVPGQIVAQLAKASGAQVIGIDPIKKRLAMAQELGALDVALDPRQVSPAERIKSLTAGRGADVVVEVSGHYVALQEAIRAAAYSAKVVALGFFQGQAAGVFFGEEFHHNRIRLICSQISGVSPALSYRWDRDRLVHTVMGLQASGALNLKPLITHVIPYQDAAEAFRLLDENPEEALQIVLDF
jgi:2-desacetyl-2-hydroxyethyl bacteriochlorophyllide A dehydrogenase